MNQNTRIHNSDSDNSVGVFSEEDEHFALYLLCNVRIFDKVVPHKGLRTDGMFFWSIILQEKLILRGILIFECSDHI